MAILPFTIGVFRTILYFISSLVSYLTSDSKRLSYVEATDKNTLNMDRRSRRHDLRTNASGQRITTLTEYLDRTKRLLQLENEEEQRRNRSVEIRNVDELCRAGLALQKLRLVHRSIGLGDRQLLEFGCSDGERKEGRIQLPITKLSRGRTINLFTTSDHELEHRIMSGVVAKVTEYSVTVAFDEDNLLDNQENTPPGLANIYSPNRKFVIVQSANNVTFQRLMAALTALKKYKQYEGHVLVEYFFGIRKLPGIDKSTISPVKYFNQSLNPSQRLAVHFCLSERHPISIIHGPPGTGKTTVVVEVIRHLIGQQKKILVCAPSNVAVDNLLEKLFGNLSSEEKRTLEFVRLGHPARTQSSLQSCTLDLILRKPEYSEVLDDIRMEIDSAQRDKGPRQYSNLKRLRYELAKRERSAITRILTKADVIFGTLTSVSREGPLRNILHGNEDNAVFSNIGRQFDVAVIDECGQATELSCWSALLAVSGGKCILAGDHRQLPPTVLSEEAAKGGFNQSLMSRAMKELGEGVVKMLTVQYRMNNQIMQWPSDNVYQGRLVAGDGVGRRILTDLPGVAGIEETEAPLWLIDTSGCGMPEIMAGDDDSKANIGELRLVYLHVRRLVRAGVPQESIAIISPYSLQVQLLRTHVCSVYRNVSVGSIDGYQGQESDAVILSLVRSNKKKKIGFLAEQQRMNVAVTRARLHLAIIADCRTVSSDRFLKSLMAYMTDNGQVKTALEYKGDYHFIPFSVNIDALTPVGPKSTDKAMPKNSKAEGKKTVGQEVKGKMTVGKETKGKKMVGQEIKGIKTVGQEIKGKKTVGQEIKGKMTVGKETKQSGKKNDRLFQ